MSRISYDSVEISNPSISARFIPNYPHQFNCFLVITFSISERNICSGSNYLLGIFRQNLGKLQIKLNLLKVIYKDFENLETQSNS